MKAKACTSPRCSSGRASSTLVQVRATGVCCLILLPVAEGQDIQEVHEECGEDPVMEVSTVEEEIN